jgi:hypothetical protein
MKKSFLLIAIIFIANIIAAQNVGISNPTPTEKLHVDSGSIKIGKLVWNASNPLQFLKFGDGNFITLGEEEADDKLTIRAKELYFRPSLSYSSLPITFTGTQNLSHFFFGPNEDTYIRSGKNGSNVNINDVGGGRVGIGMASPNRAMLEQNGVVGNTAALFGGEGAGVSIQRNWPAIGFNHWYDGVSHRSIGGGWVAQMALNQNDGSLYYSTFNDYGAPGPNSDMSYATTHLIVSRKGDMWVNGNIAINNTTDGVALKIRTSPANYCCTVKEGIRFENFPSSGGVYNWNILGESFFAFAYDGVIKATINGTNGNYSSVSDLRFKKNISSITGNILSKINELRPVTYLMKEEPESSKNNIGFISQEVEKIFPEVVSENRGIKMMNYIGLIPILTKGIQEQQQQIEILQKENATIQKELQELRKMILTKN